MSTFEKFNRKHLMQPGALQQRTQEHWGMTPAMLERHLRTMNEVASGRLSSESRRWLHEMGRQAGIDPKHVNAEIQRVLSHATPDDRMREYVGSVGGDATRTQAALQLAKRYETESFVDSTTRRLSTQDAAQAKSGTQFAFEDRDQFRRDRQEAENGVRASIEKAMVSSGLIAPKPQTLDDARARAQIFANSVADRLEKKLHTGQQGTLRDSVEDSYLAAQAMAMKSDAGISTDTPSDVYERVDAQRSFGESLADTSD